MTDSKLENVLDTVMWEVSSDCLNMLQEVSSTLRHEGAEAAEARALSMVRNISSYHLASPEARAEFVTVIERIFPAPQPEPQPVKENTVQMVERDFGVKLGYYKMKAGYSMFGASDEHASWDCDITGPEYGHTCPTFKRSVRFIFTDPHSSDMITISYVWHAPSRSWRQDGTPWCRGNMTPDMARAYLPQPL